MLGKKTEIKKYIKVKKNDQSLKEKIINPKKNINNPSQINNYNSSKNSIIYKFLVRENGIKDNQLDLASRKLTATEENDKNSQSPKNEDEKYDRYNKTTHPLEGRHKRYLKKIDNINKDFEKIPKNTNNTKKLKKNFVLSINLNHTLNNKEKIASLNKWNSKFCRILNNGDDSSFTNSNEDKNILTDPNRTNKSITNTKSRDDYYKTNNHIQNYFFINNELFNINSGSRKNTYTLDNNSRRTYNQQKMMKDKKFCCTPNQKFIHRKIKETNKYNIKKNKLLKSFILYIEKLFEIYLVKNMYHFFYCLKNLPSINKKNNIIFVQRKKYNTNIINSNISRNKYNLLNNVVNKIRNKVIYTSPEYNHRSELYRDYKELSESGKKIMRRKNREINNNSTLASYSENKYEEKEKDFAVNKNKSQLDTITNNYPEQANSNSNNINKKKPNKIILINKIQNSGNKITINIKYMDIGFDSRRDKFKGRLKITRDFCCNLKGIKNKKKQIYKKKTSNNCLNTRNNIKLDAIKEEEEKETKGEV